MRFDETWMRPAQLVRLAQLADSRRFIEGEVIEIGAWQGMSTVDITNAVFPDILHVVDHWLGSDDMPDEIRRRDNYSIFQDNMAEGTRGNYLVHKMDWREFVKGWFSPVKFLHLDAAHTVDEVADNLNALSMFAVPSAVFCGDDWNWPTVQEGVRKAFPATPIHTYLNKLWWVNL